MLELIVFLGILFGFPLLVAVFLIVPVVGGAALVGRTVDRLPGTVSVRVFFALVLAFFAAGVLAVVSSFGGGAVIGTAAGYLIGGLAVVYLMGRAMRRPVPPRVVLSEWHGPRSKEEEEEIRKRWEEVWDDHFPGNAGCPCPICSDE